MVSPAAAPLGALAAFVVLFVPMGMAGYHLSRNKMLFFSGALFISLAVVVHLSPYFPSLLSPFSSPPPVLLPLSCLSSLHSLSFLDLSSFSWPDSSNPCRFQKLPPSDAADLLNGSWILIAGDSQARLVALSLLKLILKPAEMAAVEADLFRRHSDYQIFVADHGIKLDFLWSPYESNISSAIRDLAAEPARPDVLIAGSGLWHMLHVTNATDYEEALAAIAKSAPPPPSGLFWIGLPVLVNSKLNTEEKRERMNETVWNEYNLAVDRSRICRRSGGGFFLLDVGLLSRRCGADCTADGMHYDAVVYDAAVQIMLNALLIQSQQLV